MSLAGIARNRIVVHKNANSDWRTSQFGDFLRITGVRYRWGELSFPADPRLWEFFQTIDPNAQLQDGAKDWYGTVVAREYIRASLGEQEDANLDYPTADKLWAFQRVGVNFLVQNERTLLCDEPGLGKTAQAVIAMGMTGWKRVLIVCPNSLKEWWRTEIERWASPLPQVTVAQAVKRKDRLVEWAKHKQVLILNWELLRLMPELRNFRWQWLVCDEAHRAKNRKTKTFAALKKLKSERVALLTGTPFANDVTELWTLLHITEPKKYTSFWRFYEMFVDYYAGYFGREIKGVKNAKLLRRELASRMLRRRKKDVLPELPEKLYKTIPLTLTARQLKMYRQMAEKMLVELEEGEAELRAVNTISTMLRLRQIVSTTATLDSSDHSSKLDAVVDMAQDMDEPLVVFTQFRPTVHALCARLERAKVTHTHIMGGMSSEFVAAQVRAFQEGKGRRVFVATMQAGGVGLTLHAAGTLVFVGKHYNPARQEQAADRIHRIGQRNAVQIVSLHCPGTVDDLVERILQRKLAMTAEVLQPALIQHLEEVLGI